MSVPLDRPHASETIASQGEHALIARVRERANQVRASSAVIIGIGDDAAVLEPARGELEVITTDALVEQVHFRRDWTSAHSIGAKAVAVNLSDLAAMGATPRAILLSLILPPDLLVSDFDALVDGAVSEAATAGASLVGGNISRSTGSLIIDVTATGSVGRRRVMSRSGGRPGDELYLTGTIGGAAAGLAILRSGAKRAALSVADLALVERHERPSPRLRCGRLVASSRAATACMDLSDGLADAARQIALSSGTGVVLSGDTIPLARDAENWLSRDSRDAVDAAVTGGEDYELLFAVSPRKRRSFLAAISRCQPVGATRVGTLTREKDLILERAGRRSTINIGFRHF